MLDELSPPQRVAYVLPDLFAVPFDEIGPVLDTTVAAAKKLASRARIRLRDARAVDLPGSAHQREIIDAFLAAARGGDIARPEAGPALRRPVAPMLAAPVDEVPEGAGLVQDRSGTVGG
ncbi:sigma factor-like helix-turn-helix DNA-binding protein [Micromonospora taraxaci]|uniref:sigma factor-like helix-turn-helix DNA-binding protein n=1 Tax=Micromonospora taraxaci TaxID=1316803 RepID=UPI00339EFA7A